MQVANNTTQQHLRQPTFPLSKQNELPHVYTCTQEGSEMCVRSVLALIYVPC